jgi:hypothetical protein
MRSSFAEMTSDVYSGHSVVVVGKYELFVAIVMCVEKVSNSGQQCGDLG